LAAEATPAEAGLEASVAVDSAAAEPVGVGRFLSRWVDFRFPPIRKRREWMGHPEREAGRISGLMKGLAKGKPEEKSTV
jgi:hypothetical protein